MHFPQANLWLAAILSWLWSIINQFCNKAHRNAYDTIFRSDQVTMDWIQCRNRQTAVVICIHACLQRCSSCTVIPIDGLKINGAGTRRLSFLLCKQRVTWFSGRKHLLLPRLRPIIWGLLSVKRQLCFHFTFFEVSLDARQPCACCLPDVLLGGNSMFVGIFFIH